MSIDVPRLREDLLVHAGFVHALARATLRGDSECEDLEQDVWRAALVGAPVEPTRQRPWLVSVVRRRVADLLRKRARRERRERAVASDHVAPSAADSVARAEIGRRLVNALLALEEPFRTAVLLRFQDGLPPREVAARTGVSAETARSRVRRGLERLRVTLEERERHDGRSARGVLLAMGFDEPVGSGPSTWLVGGAIVTKKTVALVAAAFVLAGGVFLLYSRRVGAVDASGTANPTIARSDSPESPVPGLASSPTSTNALGVSNSPMVAAEIDAKPTKMIRGRLVGDDGKSIVGAVIRSGPMYVDMASDAELLGSMGAVAWPSAHSDADGRFEMQSANRWGGGMYVHIHASGWCHPAPPMMSGIFLQTGAESTIRLARGVTFDVLVVDDATGNSIPGATVAVYRTRGFLLYTMHSDDETTADEAGHARLTIEGGDVRVVASAVGFATREGLAQNVGTDGVKTTVRLRRGGTLEVEIVDQKGRAVEGARVALLRATAYRTQGVSDAKGFVRFEHVPSIEASMDGFTGRRLVLVAANAEGFARTWITLEPAQDGEKAVARLELARPRVLAGQVRFRDGSAASDIRVQAATQEGRPEWGWGPAQGPSVSTTSGVDGRFELKGVTPGTVTLISGLKQEWKNGRTIELPVDGEFPLVELIAERETDRLAPVRVRILDSGGRGVADARVGIVARGTKEYSSWPASWQMTSADGSATVQPAEEGPWWLTIDSPKAGPVLRPVDATEVARGPIEVRPPEGTISGTATRLDGAPARVRLTLTCKFKFQNGVATVGGNQGAVETDAAGRFVFVGVAECVEGISCVTPGLSVVADASQVVRAGRSDLQVVIIDESEAAGLRIEVEVLDAASRAALAVPVGVDVSRDFAAGYGFAYAVPGGTALYRSEGILAPGTWHIRVHADGYESYETDVTVTAGKTSPPVRVLLEKKR